MKKLALPIKFKNHTGRVLDVGSGNNCLDIATHIIDLIPEANTERGGDLEVPAGKHFQVGSLEAIPYPNHHFDFIHASHVLEHVQDPVRALQETMRVAFGGYIETPAAGIELGAYHDGQKIPGWDFHRWVCWSFPKQSKIFLRQKSAALADVNENCDSKRKFAALNQALNFTALDPHLPYYCKMTQFAWHGSFSYAVDASLGSVGVQCQCLYCAFFSWGRVYFRDLRQVKRRYGFWRAQPVAYSLYVAGVKAVV